MKKQVIAISLVLMAVVSVGFAGVAFAQTQNATTDQATTSSTTSSCTCGKALEWKHGCDCEQGSHDASCLQHQASLCKQSQQGQNTAQHSDCGQMSKVRTCNCPET